MGGTTTQFLVDELNPTGYTQVMDEMVNGAVTKTYAYGLQRISEDQLIGSTWTPSFYGYDGHGNVRYLTNAAGAITDAYTYDAFGLLTATTGSTPNAYTYSGERFDQNIGLFHLRARDYNPLTGRFETMDPAAGNILNPATLHKYVYAGNNPVNASDPTGLSALLEGVYIDLNAGIGANITARLLPIAVRIGLGNGVASCAIVKPVKIGYTLVEDLAAGFDYEIPLSEYADDILDKVQEWCETYFPE